GRLPGARLHARSFRLVGGGPRRAGRAHATQSRVEPRPFLQPTAAAGTRRIRARARRGLSARPAARAASLGRSGGVPRARAGLSAFWFARTSSIVPNHLRGLGADGRSTECRRLEMLPLECVVRGYITGSGWKDYQATGATSGHALPEGLRESDRLPEPIFTPS